MFGYKGKLLRVNLSEGRMAEEAIDEKTARACIGGMGYATHLAYKEVPCASAPLGPENKLLFFTGPLTGTPFPTTDRYQVGTRSPLTGLWMDASSSGRWGTDLKRAGYDGIVVEGASPRPVYLWISGEGVQLRGAEHLWGRDATETPRLLRRELVVRGARVLSIGPAGERSVLISSVVNDEGRVVGRGGVGAVMGSKRLKAIAVKGNERVRLARPRAFRDKASQLVVGLCSPELEALSRWGTAAAMDVGWVTGDIPVQNWRRGVWKEGCLSLGGERLAEGVRQRTGACRGCPVRCTRWARVNGRKQPGPQYQTLASFGPLCLNDSLDVVCAANNLCARYGLDTISTGSAIAFAMEAYERGMLTSEDTGGLDLSWGNGEAILELTRQIGERRGLGEVLGEGVKRAAERLGPAARSFAVHVKGLEVPMHDPRAFFGLATSYATASRGADHVRGSAVAYQPGARFSNQGKGQLVKMAQDRSCVVNSLIICLFAAQPLSMTQIADLLNLATGFDYTAGELFAVGERIVNLQRLHNLACGLDPTEDTLPPRLLEPTLDGGHAGRVPDVRGQLEEYYRARGWTSDGRPTPAKLEELGLLPG